MTKTRICSKCGKKQILSTDWQDPPSDDMELCKCDPLSKMMKKIAIKSHEEIK